MKRVFVKKQNNEEKLDNSKQRSVSLKNTKKMLPFIGGLSFVGISSLFVVTSVGISSLNISGSLNNGENLLFDNKVFKNKEELIDYAQRNYFQGMQTVDNQISWSIDEKGETIYFNDPKLLRENLLNNIKQTTAFSSKNFNQENGGLGEVSGNDFSNLYFNQSQDELKTNIYRGKNNSIHTTIESAKDSYLSIHDAYYFNNIYFRNIEELTVYLQTVYYAEGGEGYSSTTSSKNIGLVGPSGIISSGMNSDELYKQTKDEKYSQTKKDFMNNVNSLAKKYIEFKDKDGKYFYANEEDLNNPNPALLNAFNNPEYTKLYSNEGKGTYIIDLDQDDPNTLFGPYYLQTSGDINAINDPNQWKKIDRNDPIISKEQNSNLISGLFDMLLFADEEVSNDLPFNIKYLNEELKDFYKLLEKSNKRVYDDWIKFSNDIKLGKRVNTFSNLIVFYNFLIQNLIVDGANQSIIIETKRMFNSIAEYLDKAIEALLPPELLKIDKSNSEYGDKLSFVEIFKFNSNDSNLNTDLPYFIGQISDNFSQFIVAINIINQATLNAMYNGGVLPYRHDFIDKFLGHNNGILQNSEDMIEIYEQVWNLFSSTELNSLEDEIKIKNISKTLPNNFANDLSTSLKITSSLFSTADKFIFEEFFKEIQISSSGFISNDNYDILGFINETNIYSTHRKKILKKIEEAKNSLTWENLNLIKFVIRTSPEKLIDILSFTDQKILNELLIKIIKDTSIEDFASNFIINPKMTESLISVTSNDDTMSSFVYKYWCYIEDVVIDFEPIIKILKTTTDFFKQISEDKFDSNIALELLTEISDSPILARISSTIPYIQMGLMVLDVLKGAFVPVIKYNSYKFELEDGQSFVWNGGQSTTMFFGLAPLSSSTIKDMKLLPPQNVIKPTNESSLYFNGKRYSETNLDSLKIDQLKAILNGEFFNENIKVVYSFDNISKVENNNGPFASRSEKAFYNFGTIEDLTLSSSDLPYEDEVLYEDRKLVQYIYRIINDALISTEPNHDGRDYYKNKFIFANGVSVDSPGDKPSIDVINGFVDDVIENIQSVKIAMLPNIENNKPKYNNDHNGEDGSISEYILPSRSWSGGSFLDNDTNNKYVIFDPNQENESGAVFSSSDAEQNVRNLFHEYFDVDYKTVIENEIISNNMFSELSSSIISNTIYQVKLSNNLTKYFFDEVSAFKWLLSQKNFTLYTYETENEIFKYKDQIFQSRDEFLKFVLDEATVEVN